MKLLIFGAGVLGSLYAAKLYEAGYDVTLVARGKRYRDIEEHGIVLEKFDTKEMTTTEIKVVDAMPEEYFDFCIVLVQKTQLSSALADLALNSEIQSYIFMNNTTEGSGEMEQVLGKGRIMMGHVNAGGEREEHIVRYMTADKITLGEPDGSISSRLVQIADVFKKAGFPVELNKNINAWKIYHVGLIIPFANALYMVGGSNYELARNKEAIKKCMAGIREAFAALRALGHSVEPRKLLLFVKLPDIVIVPLLRRVIKTELMDIGGARHAKNAREEMIQLNRELMALVRKSGIETPVLEELSLHSDY